MNERDAAFGVSKAIGSVMNKLGDAEQESIRYDTLKRSLGDVNVSFAVLRDSIRHAAAGMDTTFDEAAASEEWPMKICVFRRMDHWTSRHILAERALDRLLEDLDEEYGDHDGEPTEPSESMKRASLAFADSILKEYMPFMCEPTGEVIEITKQQAEEAWP